MFACMFVCAAFTKRLAELAGTFLSVEHRDMNDIGTSVIAPFLFPPFPQPFAFPVSAVRHLCCAFPRPYRSLHRNWNLAFLMQPLDSQASNVGRAAFDCFVALVFSHSFNPFILPSS